MVDDANAMLMARNELNKEKYEIKQKANELEEKKLNWRTNV